MPTLSLALQLFGFYGVCTWVLALPETAMGESGDVEFREGC